MNNTQNSKAGNGCQQCLVRDLLPADRRLKVHGICRLPKGFRLLQPFEKITNECKFTRPTSPKWVQAWVSQEWAYDPEAYYVHAIPNDLADTRHE